MTDKVTINPAKVLQFRTDDTDLARQLDLSGEWDVTPLAGYPETGDATWRCTRR